MKAIYRNKYGSSETLELREVEKPIPNDNQLLIKVHAASVNPLDWHVMRGEPFLIRLMGFGIFKPNHNIFGADMAGRVESVGKDVTQFKVGDEVFGSGIGGFAEYARLDEKTTVLKPAGQSFEEVAAVPVAGITSLQALRDQGKLEAGQQVLINGASGGVGTFAVQIAKVMSAEVTGVCSGKNVEMVRSIGADYVVGYTKENYWETDKKYDLIIDNAAFYSVNKPLQALKPKGKYVVIGGSSAIFSILKSIVVNPIIAKIKGRKVISFIARLNQEDLVYLNELLESKKVIPVVDRTYSLKETPEAISYVEEGHTRGKVVIKI